MTRIRFVRRLFWLQCLLLAGCGVATSPPKDHTILQHVDTELHKAVESNRQKQQVPEAVNTALLPPLRITMPNAGVKQLEQRFDLMVTSAPASQVFLSIVSGTRYSIIVPPEINGAISINLKDVTVFEALDTIREVYGYDYKLEGARIFIQRPGLQTKIYRVNYITGLRSGQSDIRVTGGTGNNTGSASTGSASSSTSSTSNKADLWKEVEDTIRTILACNIPGQTEVQTTTATPPQNGTANIPTIIPGETRRERGISGCVEGKSVIINQFSNTILVRAMPEDLRTIESVLHTMQLNIERQVIIEAKIIDVQLNSGSQQGINWALFNNGGHVASIGANTGSFSENGGQSQNGLVASTLSNVLGAGMVGLSGSAFSAGLGVALQLRNFSTMINFLQSQGDVHVLSSPRIASINNQKAILKIGTDEQFVSGFSSNGSATATGGGTVVSNPTPTYSTYFSGISMDVTPQIDDEDNITLHVHPMVSSVSSVDKATGTSGSLPFASNNISETDSVVKVKDGQIVVIGGLMSEKYEDTRDKLPGISDTSVAGTPFRKGSQTATKRELVILLKPTIVRGDNVWADEISVSQQRIESFGKEAKPTVR